MCLLRCLKVIWVEAKRILAWSLLGRLTRRICQCSCWSRGGLKGCLVGGIAGVSMWGLYFVVMLGFVVWGLCNGDVRIGEEEDEEDEEDEIEWELGALAS
ncbi:hypothetical protein Syun_031155 [Stephania yunnanensis]|uniref:Transmembrane protein n=1 Tax=Stephania yunnanensis TaxID=152371 RepID=A0AAP0DZW8_9MAGN